MKQHEPHSQNADDKSPDIRGELDSLAPGLSPWLDRASSTPVQGADAASQEQLQSAILSRVQQLDKTGVPGEGTSRPRNLIRQLLPWSAVAAALAAVLMAGWYLLDQPQRNPSPESEGGVSCLSFNCQLQTLDDNELTTLVQEVVLTAHSDAVLKEAAADVSWNLESDVLLESADAMFMDFTDEELGTLLNL